MTASIYPASETVYLLYQLWSSASRNIFLDEYNLLLLSHRLKSYKIYEPIVDPIFGDEFKAPNAREEVE